MYGSILSDSTIKQMAAHKTDDWVFINPFRDENVQPASYDITIGDSFTFEREYTEVGELITGPKRFDEPVPYMTVTCDSYALEPKKFVLATTEEYIQLPYNITAFVEGRSSIGRLGLFIQNAGWVDPGFEGQITLELFNASDRTIIIPAGARVGQLVFAMMDVGAQKPYSGKYQGQIGATGSMVYKDFAKG